MSDDEPVDPRLDLEKKLKHHCDKDWQAYQACVKRIEKLPADSGKNCGGWYNEFYQCLDHHVITNNTS